jgi:hypothetical protein
MLYVLNGVNLLDPSRHKRRKFTKEDAYLGIWAEHDDDRPDRKKK